MHKKLMVACMAIAAFAAFVVAPAASASPALTEDGIPNVLIPVGTTVIGTNTGNTEFTGGFNVTCDHAELTGVVTENSGSKIAGAVAAGAAIFTGTAADDDCTSALGNTKPTLNSALCFETVKNSDNVLVTGCEGKPVTFSLNVTGVITCRYSTSSVTAQYKTATTATINVENQGAFEEEPKSFFCPDEGKLKMDFDLYTDDNGVRGTALSIS